MSKQDHKRWRKAFNEGCLKRDAHKCVFCEEVEKLDVHHITDRHDLPNGGYALSNGITVCEEHHMCCEMFHMEQFCKPEYLPEALYERIGSSYEQANKDSEKLK